MTARSCIAIDLKSFCASAGYAGRSGTDKTVCRTVMILTSHCGGAGKREYRNEKNENGIKRL